jgi:hypothetical protein
MFGFYVEEAFTHYQELLAEAEQIARIDQLLAESKGRRSGVDRLRSGLGDWMVEHGRRLQASSSRRGRAAGSL